MRIFLLKRIKTSEPNKEKDHPHSSYDAELAYLGYDCAWLCSMLDTLALSSRALRLGKHDEVATSGINGDKGMWRFYKDHDTCRALLNTALVGNDCCSFFVCLFITDFCFSVSQNKRTCDWERKSFCSVKGLQKLAESFSPRRVYEDLSPSSVGHASGTAFMCEVKAYLSLCPPPVPVIIVTCSLTTLCQLPKSSFWLSAVDEGRTCWPGWRDEANSLGDFSLVSAEWAHSTTRDSCQCGDVNPWRGGVGWILIARPLW